MGGDLFSPTDWAERSVVHIAGKAKGGMPFFAAMTGHEWVLTLRFRVGHNTFEKLALAAQLGLRRFSEVSPPVLSDSPRVDIKIRHHGFQEVIITACNDDLDTPAFDAFLTRAVTAYRKLGRGGAIVTASEL